MSLRWEKSCLLPDQRHVSGHFVFLLDLPFTPCFFFVSFHTRRALWVISTTPQPPNRHGTVGKLASKPPPHSGLKGVISFLSPARRQGKETSTAKQRAPTAWVAHKPALEKLQLGRRQPRSSSPLPCRTVTPTNPQSVRWGPFSFTLILSHPLSNRQVVLGLTLKNLR